MLIYATTCKTYNNSKKGIVQAIVASFLRQLRGWWDHYLTEIDRQKILTAIKTDKIGRLIKTKKW